MFTTYVLLTFLAVLMYFLIRTVVNEIKQHITEETDRVIRLLKIRTMWVDEEAVILESDEALNILSE